MKAIKTFIFSALLGACVVIGYGLVYVSQPLSLAHLPLEFSIKAGSSVKSAAKQMHAAGVLNNEISFVLLTRLMDQTDKIKSGDYLLEKSATPLELLEILSKGLVIKVELTIIEGSTFNQLRDILNQHPKLSHDTQGLTEHEILQRIGATETRAEGLFFPDTYRIASGTSDLDLLKQSYALMQQHLQQSWDARAPNLLLKSPYDALILASIVEKETGQAGDRDKIAAVFHNRLRIGMMLQTDPTVIYGMGERFNGNIRKRDLIQDTPYNTYTRAGLPPTPIALPGLAAIEATLHPAAINALYFVARGDGTTKFSDNLNDHNHAVNTFQK
jgi:UPF0755 protein